MSAPRARAALVGIPMVAAVGVVRATDGPAMTRDQQRRILEGAHGEQEAAERAEAHVLY